MEYNKETMTDETLKSSALLPYLVIISVVGLSSLLALMPFLLNIENVFSIYFVQTGMQAVYRFWDGPLYVVVSHTMYTPESPLYAASGLWASYYAAHFPLYPFAILVLSPFGVFEAMIIATILFAAAAAVMFYQIVKEFELATHPLLLTLFFAFFPLRWFLYRNVGASEPAFIFLCLAAIYFLKKDQIPYFVVAAILATFTRIFGILLFPVLLITLIWKKQLNLKNFLLSLLIPASILLLFTYYFISFGDFFAYFAVNGGDIHEPFRIMVVFSDSYFRELYGILIVIYAVAAVSLWERGEKEMALFTGVYLALISLVTHGDASRYMLPMAPFALIGFERVFPKNKILFAGIIVLVAVLAFIYAWTMIPLNPVPEEMYLGIRNAL